MPTTVQNVEAVSHRACDILLISSKHPSPFEIALLINKPNVILLQIFDAIIVRLSLIIDRHGQIARSHIETGIHKSMEIISLSNYNFSRRNR